FARGSASAPAPIASGSPAANDPAMCGTADRPGQLFATSRDMPCCRRGPEAASTALPTTRASAAMTLATVNALPVPAKALTVK
ncbi:hypothetical protein, partial [Enterobacter hormaechei]|uniref:hypothetical protein n=1 Tax=Enterobacter hormaechei TaxID=158836 RepID=UPI0013D29599